MRSAAPPPRLITWRATATPCAPRDLARTVAGTVVHHQHRGLDSAHPLRDLGQHLADAVLLVVGGDHHGHAVLEPFRQPGRAELVPRDALQHPCQLAIDASRQGHVAQQQDEHHEDREHREAQDATAAALAEREEAEHRVGDLGRRHERQRDAGQQQREHVGVAQRPPPPDGEDDHQDAEDETGGAQGRQVHGAAQDSGRGRSQVPGLRCARSRRRRYRRAAGPRV